MLVEIHIRQRIAALTLKAAQKYNIAPEKCHIGHIVLQAMLEEPSRINQIDAMTVEEESHLSVAIRSMRLASAMHNSGLKVGDHVINMGHNHLDLCIPFYACHYNGYTQCSVDPRMSLSDLTTLFKTIDPRMVFCPKDKEEDIEQALKNNKKVARIVTYGDSTIDLEAFIDENKGTNINFQPAVFDQSETICWLMLTSGTTGLPKVAIVPYNTLLNSICSWWSQFTEKCNIIMTISTIQWMSSLYFFISSPLMKTTRLQASVSITTPVVMRMINHYKPNITAWSPFLLAQFVREAEDFVDMSCFKYIAIGGSAIDKSVYEQLRKKCSAYLYLVYGMTELLVPVFDFNKNTPFGSTGKGLERFQYKLVNDDDNNQDKTNTTGELWIKGDAFFKGYLNNKEETEKLLTKDGWVKTGDIFHRDENGYYFFVERKRLLIKYTGFWISPLQLEEVIKKHPGVEDACVVGISDQNTNQTPVAAIVKKKGINVEPQEIFDLVKDEMPQIKQIHGGIFFMDALPETPSGKVHRTRLQDYAITAEKTFSVKQ